MDETGMPASVAENHVDTAAATTQLTRPKPGEADATTTKPPRTEAEFTQRDGGWGWVVCFTAFWANGTIFGLHKSFGVIYVSLLTEFGENDKENIAFRAAWIGSCCVGVMLLCAVFSGALVNSIGLRKTASLGVLLASLGMVASSFVNTLELFYLTYSAVVGFGTSMIYTTHTLIPVHYFKKKFGLANGITLLGGCVFGSFMPIVIATCLRNLGLSWTLRILAGYMSLLFACVCTWKEQIPKAKSTCCHSFMDKCCLLRKHSPLTNRRFVMYIICVGLVYFTLFVPFVHVVNHARQILPHMQGELTLLVAGISSALSRVSTGKLSDSGYVQRLTLYQCATVVMGVACSVLPFAHDAAGLLVVCVVFGAMEGCILCLHVPIAIDLIGLQDVQAAIGTLFSVAAIPQTFGPPVAGWLYDATGTYRLSFYVAGAPLLLSAVLIFVVKRLKDPHTVQLNKDAPESHKPMLEMKDMNSEKMEEEPERTISHRKDVNSESQKAMVEITGLNTESLKPMLYDETRESQEPVIEIKYQNSESQNQSQK